MEASFAESVRTSVSFKQIIINKQVRLGVDWWTRAMNKNQELNGEREDSTFPRLAWCRREELTNNRNHIWKQNIKDDFLFVKDKTKKRKKKKEETK